jgi:hypothetical protein
MVGRPYEVAVAIACAADRYATGSSPGAEAAATIRDVFATWAQRMHSCGSPTGDLAQAEAAHRDITVAARYWIESGRDDVSAFAARSRTHVGAIDTKWMNQEPTSLVRTSRLRRLLDQFRRIYGAPEATRS